MLPEAVLALRGGKEAHMWGRVAVCCQCLSLGWRLSDI